MLASLLALGTLVLAGCGTETIYATEIAITDGTAEIETLELTVGDTAEIYAVVTPEDATDATVTWTVDDETILTVEDGTITALDAGTAVITATANGAEEGTEVTDTLTVTVKEAGVLSYKKLGVYQGANTQWDFFNGTYQNTYYWGTTTDFDEAVTIAVTEYSDGFTMQIEDSTSSYDGYWLTLVVSGNYVNPTMVADEPEERWYIDEDTTYICMTTTSGVYFLGTYGTYNTISASSYSSYATSSTNYGCHLYETDPSAE